MLHDAYLVQKMQHFNRERIPERVVHAKGSGAHGFFEVTEDVTQWTSASFLSEVGKRTPMFARFSHGRRRARAAPTRSATRAASRSSSTPTRATTTSSATTRRTFFVRDASKF